MKDRPVERVRTAFVSTYPPRQCGIATFTQDLAASLADLYDAPLENNPYIQVVAVDNLPGGYPYPGTVRFAIREQHKADYREAADFLNLSPVEVVSLQHEFGIFGGPAGDYVLSLLAALKKPVVTTVHTVLREPEPVQRETLQAVCDLSTFVVVLAERAEDMLAEIYGVPREKIVMIHHGTPDVPFLDPAYYKDQFQAEGRRVILSFGLLSPNKGIEVALEAVEELVKEFPDLLYLVVGATHPEVKRRYGEAYRLSLERMVQQKGLQDHVVFYNRFVSQERLLQFLVAADVYLTPYLSREQIASGTLAYAVACGKAVVSTPYWYAEEILAEERGLLVPFRDPRALATRVAELLRDDMLRNRLRKNAYRFGRQMVWRSVAMGYAEVFERARSEFSRHPPTPGRPRAPERQALPEVNLSHLQLLTDDTGILQHARYTTPDRFHGYCTDDNARALLVTVMNWRLFQDERILPLLHRYLAFLTHALDPETGRVRNFLSYDRRWVEAVGSEDSHGRALWALGYTVAHAPGPAICALANQLFRAALRGCSSLRGPRPWSYALLGCDAYLTRFGGDTETRTVVVELAGQLLDLFETHATDDWPWCEPILTYDNARMPQALLVAGSRLDEGPMVEMGLRALTWLLQLQTDTEDGHLSVIGNDGWYPRGGPRARFDQQPLEVAALVDACQAAYRVTQDRRWRRAMDTCFSWFFGHNDRREPLYDFATGGCFDGLQAGGVNQNQGGESTVSWLLALHRMYEVAHDSSLRAAGHDAVA